MTGPRGGPRPGPVPAWYFAVRQLRFWLTDYRRTWRGSIVSTVLNPLLYLGAMGLGLGTLVDKHGTASLGQVSYLVFLAPGLLAASAMGTGVGESTYPVFGSVKWNKTYQAAVSSPLRPADLFHGHLLFVGLKLTMTSAGVPGRGRGVRGDHLAVGHPGPAGRGAHRPGLHGGRSRRGR